MTDAGFQPALVVETSPQNFQVWLNHGRISRSLRSTRAAKELASDSAAISRVRTGDISDDSRASQIKKPERRLAERTATVRTLASMRRTGLHRGCGIPPRGNRTRSGIAAAHARSAASVRSRSDDAIRPLADFHAGPRYAGDLHRADMAWALHAASRGLSEEQIRDEILSARDLSKKGHSARQRDYAKRTAIKAVTIAQPLH